jgi:hypothetical protein
MSIQVVFSIFGIGVALFVVALAIYGIKNG